MEGSRVSQLPRRRGRRRPRVCAGLRIPPPSPGREGAEPGVTGPAVPSPAPLPLPSPRRSQPPARPRELGAASAAGAGPGCAHARRVSAAAGGGERARGWGSGLRCWGARGRSLEGGRRTAVLENPTPVGFARLQSFSTRSWKAGHQVKTGLWGSPGALKDRGGGSRLRCRGGRVPKPQKLRWG